MKKSFTNRSALQEIVKKMFFRKKKNDTCENIDLYKKENYIMNKDYLKHFIFLLINLSDTSHPKTITAAMLCIHPLYLRVSE